MGGIYSVIEICSKIVLKGQNYWILFPSNTPLISPTKDAAKKIRSSSLSLTMTISSDFKGRGENSIADSL